MRAASFFEFRSIAASFFEFRSITYSVIIWLEARPAVMNKVTASSGCAAALPTALLAEVLQHVPQQQRLSQCALVSTSWAPAAAQATVHVAGDLKPDTVPALQSWLAHNAGQLLSVKLHGGKDQTLQLPLDKLTQLQHLQLVGFNLQLPGEEAGPCTSPCVGSKDSSSSQGSSSSSNHAAQLTLPSLQHLKLISVQLASVSSLLQLTNTPQLSSLTLSYIDVLDLGFSSSLWASPSEGAMQKVADAVASMLQQLPRLSVLLLPDMPFTDAAVQQMAAMQGLQQVTLRHREHVPTCHLQHLPSSITQLQLHGEIGSPSPSLPQELPQLSGLLHLELNCCKVPPMVLASLTQLQVLDMEACDLLPHDPDADWETEGTAALLTALSSLTCLQDLTLSNLLGMDTETIAPEQFSALTASSHLVRLTLSREDLESLPKGAAQHMFPPGRQMQFLQQVVIETGLCQSEAIDDWCLDGADLGYIIQACPSLQCLNIRHSVQADTDLSPLLQLPESCTRLMVAGAAFTDAAAPLVAQLTQLEYLVWSGSPGLTDAGHEKLTGIDLYRLYMHDCGLSEAVLSAGQGSVELEWTPDMSVPEQLDALLDSSPVLAPARLKKHKAAAAAAAAATAAKAKKLQLELKHWRERYRGARAKVEQLQQQLDAAKAGQQQQQQLEAAQAGQQQQ